ncbi:hypothetical protein CV102_03890 [Natronococcus pandeyae]|uniref:DUF8130 domain-containing protein n=1 Tax=Natronococcus pandeyae TaxID=2055836 RepID=A0A8J8Q6G0_9EURY|nr:hypothetical protein [Natronococcus pandeyae]TYL39448.1 hypothetical protein CV102_03890 [Natronococcus pandeyae]
MNRRALLAGTGLALATTAGCLETAAETGDASTDDPGAKRYHVSLDVTDEQPAAEFDTELAVEVVTESVRDAAPAEIRVSLTNAESGSITVGSGPGWPFGVLTLTRDAGNEFPERVPFTSDRYDESEYIPDDVSVSDSVDDGETVTAVYELHADAKNLEPATYDLEVTASLEGGDRTGGHALTAAVEVLEADS